MAQAHAGLRSRRRGQSEARLERLCTWREETSGTPPVPEEHRVEVHVLGWLALAAIIIVMIAVDIVGHVKTPHEPSMKEAAWWSVAYIAMAIVFGLMV